MALACIDSCLENLIHSNHIVGSHFQVRLLKLELRLMRTFFLYATKWSNCASLSSSSCSVKNAVSQFEHEFISFLSLSSKDRLSSYAMGNKANYFHDMIRSIKKLIIEVYTLSGCLLQSSCPPVPVVDVLMEFIDSLVQNLMDLQAYNEHLQDPFDLELEEKLSFLKKFIRLVGIREVEERTLERFLIHCEVVAVNAAHSFHLRSLHNIYGEEVVDEMLFKVSEQLQDPHVHEIYIQVLIASKLQESSHCLATKAQKYIVGDFMDSLLGNLCKRLDYSNSCKVSGKHQMLMLYEGLKFLRTIIKKPEKFDGLHEKTKDLFGAMVTDAGIVIFSLHMHEMGKGWTREMDLSLLSLLEKIKPIKVEVAEKCLTKSTFNYPVATNELDFIGLLIENLKQLAKRKVDSNSYAMERFQEVQEDLVFFKSFLENTVVQCNQDEKLQALWNRIIDVAYKVEFVTDSLIVGDISYSPLFNIIIEEIKLVKTETLEIDTTKHVFESLKADNISSHLPSLGTPSTFNEVVVGFKDEAQEIIGQLTRGSMQLDIVSIVGMPGLGKTTLANKVYHDPSILLYFHIRAWCFVSQVYCRKDLLLEILGCIVPKHSNQYLNMEEDDLAEELRRRLKGNKYVIVLDDVWGIEAWNILKLSFPDDANGSRILLTSRLCDVALLVKPTGKPFPLRRLTDDESWELLQKKLILKRGYPPALDVLGMQIARNCNGLPLAVVIIAGILITLEQVGWEEVAERTSSKIVCDTEQCMNVLELSYMHLPNYLKPCLLYFGAFLEDQEIPVGRLVSLWIAEGFVQKNELRSLEDMAKDYIMALIRRSLVMVAKRNSMGGVKTCRIHDLLHEFCVAKAKEANFLQFVHGYDEFLNFDEPYNLRRLCIYSQRKHFVISRLFCPNLRSLLFLSRGDQWYYAKSDNLLFILRLKLLRVLDLGEVLGTFPVEIFVLVQLRYLAIEVEIEDIPSSIANLSNLETLILRAYRNVLLPDTIWNMQKLRHLDVSSRLGILILAQDKTECSSHLYNLHTFANPRLYLGKRMEKIMRKVPNIRKLKCSVIFGSDESMEANKKSLVMDFLSQLESLVLKLYWNVRPIDIYFPLNLKELTLKTFPWSIIFQIGKLPNLEVLKLHNVHGFKIWEMEEGEFPKLNFLKLRSIDIIRWVGSGEHFPCLQKLVLEDCWDFEELPSCLEYIPTLELIEVHRCPKSLSNLVQKIEEKHMNMGNVDMKILILKECD